MSNDDNLDSLILEATTLVSSVYRDLGIFSPGRRTTRSNRNAVSLTLSPQAERQIANINDVMNSVDNNLRQQVQQNMDEAVAVVSIAQQQNTSDRPARERAGTTTPDLGPTRERECSPLPAPRLGRRPAQQQNPSAFPPQSIEPVVIDLCLDSPKNDDVILVPHIVPGVISLDTPSGGRIQRRTRLQNPLVVESNGHRSRSRSPVNVANKAPLVLLAAQDHDTSASGGLKCPICMEDAAKRQPATTKCGHVFCKECIVQAIRLNHKCPICKAKLTERMLIRIFI